MASSAARSATLTACGVDDVVGAYGEVRAACMVDEQEWDGEEPGGPDAKGSDDSTEWEMESDEEEEEEESEPEEMPNEDDFLCPKRLHPMKLLTVIPADYPGVPACDHCLTANLHRDPRGFWHCFHCRYDCCATCADDDEARKTIRSAQQAAPKPYKVPVREVCNHALLKGSWPVLRVPASGGAPGKDDRRVWTVDHFAASLYCFAPKNPSKPTETHDAKKLVLLDKVAADPRRLRLRFLGVGEQELLFPSSEDRERFFQSAVACGPRPGVKVYAPALTFPKELCAGTMVDAAKKNATTVRVPRPFGAGGDDDRELVGKARLSTSSIADEGVRVWCGTVDVGGTGVDAALLKNLVTDPADFDLIVLSAQSVDPDADEDGWAAPLQAHLGEEYTLVGEAAHGRVRVAVCTRTRHLPKVSGVQKGAANAPTGNPKGDKGAAAVSFRFGESSLCFIALHLAARADAKAQETRERNLEEIFAALRLGDKQPHAAAEVATQFDHCWLLGNTNSRVDLPWGKEEVAKAIKDKKWPVLFRGDQFRRAMATGGLLPGFQEGKDLKGKIDFAPTYRLLRGKDEYHEDGLPCWPGRVLVKSLPGSTALECEEYRCCPDAAMRSEHRPTVALYWVRCLRPHLGAFDPAVPADVSLHVEEVKVAGGPPLAKPLCVIHSAVAPGPHKGAPLPAGGPAPVFGAAALPPPLRVVNAMQDWVQSQRLHVALHDAGPADPAAPKGPPRGCKTLRASAAISFRGRAEIGREHQATGDLLAAGRAAGTVTVKYRFTVAVSGLAE